jgi:hypothetical protein
VSKDTARCGGGAALAATPWVASADPSSDWLSSIDQVLGGLSVPAADPAQALDMQISIDGTDLFPTAGNIATATSGMGDIAIAIGNGASASATGGIFDSAFAVGNSAPVGDVIGHTAATTEDGNFDDASAIGTFSVAFAGHGNGDSAIVFGNLGSAFAGWGNDDLASIVSTNTGGILGDGADAGGVSPALFSPFLLGNDDIAVVVGEGSSASAGADLLTVGNSDLAAVFGDMLSAAEFGVSNMVDIAP